jgi:hypothetical protein
LLNEKLSGIFPVLPVNSNPFATDVLSIGSENEIVICGVREAFALLLPSAMPSICKLDRVNGSRTFGVVASLVHEAPICRM